MAVWSSIEICSVVSELEWVQCIWDDGVDVCHDKLKCYMARGYLGVLGHRDYGGLLETCKYYRLGHAEVENVSEDTCQMFSTCSEY
jgi:hypothetical protein